MTVQKIDVVYLYEHAARELDVACLVNYLAEQRYGLHIKIAQVRFDLFKILSKFNPHIVVVPFCYFADAPYLYTVLLYWPQAIYFNLAWEEILSPATYQLKAPRDEFSRKHVLHHAWADFYVEYLRAHQVREEHIFLNGNPTLMLYDLPYCQYYEQREAIAHKHNLDPTKRWIFFPESYKRAFLSESDLKKFARLGKNPETVYSLHRFHQQSLMAVMRWCGIVASQSDVELIVRPRPATPLKSFKAAVQEALPSIPPRIHFIKSGTVREWILASDVVFSSDSTTLIEAAAAGKPTYIVEPYPLPDYTYNEWQDHVPHLKTQAEFEAACLGSLANYDNQLGTWARTTMMACGDAISNLADFLARLHRGEIQRPPVPSRASLVASRNSRLPWWLSDAYLRVYWWAKREVLKRSNTVGKSRLQYENDFVSPVELERKLARWGKIVDNAISAQRK